MTLPGPPPSRPQSTIDRLAQLERTVRTMQAAPKLGTASDATLYSDALSTSPRMQIQNVGASMSLNIPRGVLLYTPTPTASVARICFVQQNASVSAATIGAAIYVGTDPTALQVWGAGQVSITASLADIYLVLLNNTGPLPAGYILVLAQAFTVGATVPSLAVSGQAPVNTFLSTGPYIWTCMVGSATLSPWPTQMSVSVTNTTVWNGSPSPVWLAVGS